jgi:hypothetical protein
MIPLPAISKVKEVGIKGLEFIVDPEPILINEFKTKMEVIEMPTASVNEIPKVQTNAQKIETIAESVNKQIAMVNDLNLDDISIEVNVTITPKDRNYRGTLIINPNKGVVKTLLNNSIAEGNATIQELTSEIENTELTVTIN